MASFMAQFAKACFTQAGRTGRPVSLPRRSLRFSPSVTRGVRFSSTASAVAEENPETSSETETLPTFDTLEGKVSNGVLAAINAMKITHMSPVQAQVFPLLPDLARPYNAQEPSTGPARDLLVKAKTGTGKTLGFLVPAVEARLKSIHNHGIRSARDAGKENDSVFVSKASQAFARNSVGTLVISPTRELATQIAQEALRLTGCLERDNRDFGVRLFVGGEDKGRQIRQFKTGRNDIVVATPGRLRDLLDSQPDIHKAISTTQVLILDEADTLLDMGFRSDIEDITKELPSLPERQTFLFSATVSRAIQDIARSTLSPNHKFINCVSKDSSPVHAHIPQYQTVVSDASQHIPHILRLISHDQLSNPNASKIVLFLPTTKMTQLFATLLRSLSRMVLPAGAKTAIYEIHSKKPMAVRTNSSNSFRHDSSGAAILVTSDVSARGVDYPNVSRVIQVSIPASTEQYIHRVGRTGRAGTQGRGDLVLLPWEKNFIRTSLSSVPLKQLRSEDLQAEVLELAKAHDTDPAAFFADAPQRKPNVAAPRFGRARSRTDDGPLFPKIVAPIVEETNSAVDNLKNRIDGEAINETFFASLGYYMGRVPALGVPRDHIVQGLQTWTTDAMGLPQAPYVSEAMLVKFGAGSSHRGGSRRPSFGRGESRFGHASRDRENRGWGAGSRGRDQDGSYGSRDQDRPYRSRERDDTFGSRSFSRGDREGSHGNRSFGRDNDRGSYGRRSVDRSDGEKSNGESYPWNNGERSKGDRSFRRDDSEGRAHKSYEEMPRNRWMGRGSASAKSKRY